MNKKLEWEEKFSVGVALIDNQHKKMFSTINELIDLLVGVPTNEQVDNIIKALVEYKQFHFVTEKRYFDEFKYERTEEHKACHDMFNDKLGELILKNREDSVTLAFQLVDFLEDWLLDHLMVEDQRYVECFHEHGLT